MYRFDDFRVNPESLRIFRGDTRLDTPPQVVEVLVHLLTNRRSRPDGTSTLRTRNFARSRVVLLYRPPP